MDIKKLKYDLSLQCAVMDVMNEASSDNKPSDYDIRTQLLEKFESNYHFYSMLDESRWEAIKDLN